MKIRLTEDREIRNLKLKNHLREYKIGYLDDWESINDVTCWHYMVDCSTEDLSLILLKFPGVKIKEELKS